MKRAFLFMLVLTLCVFLFTACGKLGSKEGQSTPAGEEPLKITDISEDGILGGSVRLGMPKAEMFAAMEGKGLTLLAPSEEDGTITEDGGLILPSNSEIAYYSYDDYTFGVNSEGAITDIFVVNDAEFATAAGLKLGGTLEDMTWIYGDQYVVRRDTFGNPYYVYQLRENYLMIGIAEEVVAIRYSIFDKW